MNPDITELIPQRPPFIMVGELLFADDTITRTRFMVDAANPLFGRGRFTAGGLLENIAQTAAAGAGYRALGSGGQVTPGHIVSVSRFAIGSLPLPGDELITEVVIRTRIPDIIVISGRVFCGGVEIAACEMKILTNV